VRLARLTVVTDTPGFTALIRAGASPSGPFSPVSTARAADEETTFRISGDEAQYYVVWITNLGPAQSVHVNEVTAAR
jgi:hypothetical protein